MDNTLNTNIGTVETPRVTTSDKIYDLTKEIVDIEKEMKDVSTAYKEKIKSEESFIRKLTTMDKDVNTTTLMKKSYLKLRGLKTDFKNEMGGFKDQLVEIYNEIDTLLDKQ